MDKKEKTIQDQSQEDYSQDDFLSDLKKVSNPVNKPDKPKSASGKT